MAPSGSSGPWMRGPSRVPYFAVEQGVQPTNRTATNNLEGGTNGSAITPANSGGASGNAFDVVDISGGGAITYDSTVSAHGGLSAKTDDLGTLNHVIFGWGNPSLGSLGDGYGRAYINIASFAGFEANAIKGFAGSPSPAFPSYLWLIRFTTGGMLVIFDAANNATGPATGTAVSAGSWFRVEWHHSASAELVVEVYLTPDAPRGSPDQTLTAASAVSTKGFIGGIGFDTNDPTTWFDDLVAGAPTWVGPVVTPPLSKQVVARAGVGTVRPARRGGVITSTVQAAASAAGAATPPIPKQVVLDEAALLWRRQQHRGAVIESRPVAMQVTVTPTPSRVAGQAEQTAIRRARHGSLVQNRWSGYQWVGLPAITLTPKQVVQDAAAVWQARQDHRRGQVIAPGVQTAAAAAAAPPVVSPLPKQVVVDQAALEQPRLEHRRGAAVTNRWPGYQWVGLPAVTPLPHQIVVLARATPRRARAGHVTQPRTLQAPITPPRPIILDLCPATTRRARGGHVVIGRPNTSPITPPRQKQVQQGGTSRRPTQCGVSTSSRQRFATGTGPPPPSTLITTPATGYVAVGDHGAPSAGDTGYPQGVVDGLAPSLRLAPSATLAPSQGHDTLVGITSPVTVGATGLIRV